MFKLKNKKKMIILISGIVVILWMILIFKLSSQVADRSNQLSKGVTKVIVETVGKVSHNEDFDMNKLNHYVRKNAHFFAYLILGVLMMNVLRRCGGHGSKVIVLALGACILYAISDEFHQFYVPGRGPGIKDVLIDSAGACVGIFVYLGLSKTKKGFTNRL